MYTLLILLIIIFVPIPIMMKYMLTGKNAYRGVLEGIISAVIGVIMVFLFSQVMTGSTIFERMDSILSSISVADMNLSGMYGMFGLNKLDPEELQLVMDNMKEMMKLSLPGVIILWSSIFAYFNYLLISWLLRKSGKLVSQLPPFRTFSLPKSMMLGSVLIYGLSYLAGNMGIIDKNLIMLNVQMIFGFVFSVQGLAVVFYYGKLRKVPKAIVLLISAVFISTGFGQTALFILGLTDIAFDTRKRFSQKQA